MNQEAPALESSTGRAARRDGQAALERLAPEVHGFVSAARAPATLKAYRSDWDHFVAWCHDHDVQALPADPEVVAAYLADLAATRKPATIQRRLSSISQAHKAAGHSSPADEAIVRETHRGIRRTLSTKPGSATPLRLADLQRLVTSIPSDTLAGIRDHALILVGFWGALRRGELVGLDVGDLEFRTEGMAVTITSSKTDQVGQGHLVGLPRHQRLGLDPVRGVQRWLDRSGITTGPLFRAINRHGDVSDNRLSAQSVNLILKSHATVAGIEGDITGHSLRAGFATSAAEAGVAERLIMNQTRHRSTITVRRYIRDGELFASNAAGELINASTTQRSQVPGTTLTAREWILDQGAGQSRYPQHQRRC